MIPSLKINKLVVKVPVYLAIIILSVIWIAPILTVFLVSFKTEGELTFRGPWSIPELLILDNYIEAWFALKQYLYNTLIIAIPSAIASVFVASLGAYALARINFKVNNYFFLLFIAGLAIPQHMSLISLFRLMYRLGLYNTYLAQIITHIAFGIPICVLVLRNFFLTISKEIDDAARIDGCSELGIYFRMILPLSKAALITMIGFQFMWIWNTLGWGLVLASDPSVMPIAVGLLNFKGQYFIKWTWLAAGAVLASTTPIILFLLIQKYFYKGFIGMSVSK